MFTFYWISILVFWIVGLTVWNKLYPKSERSEK
ncbi:hypothetical protein JOC48_000868 [Aquibacillus albus]|uniref:Uncharacterized protein n=1 Tax=Aquibacillus albus TaxID=1168171 RepID=A0ABS2MXH2_9BACI|nr:hypothetical protein [Aquibacillus albus]